MRMLGVFAKSIKEQIRDPLVLSLSLAFAPLFVILYAMFFPASGSTSYGLLLLNQDQGIQVEDGIWVTCGDQVIEALESVSYADGSPLLDVELVDEREAAADLLRNREAHALMILPEDLSRSLLGTGQAEDPAQVIFVGDLTNPYYAVAAVMADAAFGEYVQQITGQPRLVQVTEQPLGASAARTEFEVYIPGILIFAVVMLIFQASMTVAREVEAGTLRRLRISRMTSWEYLAGTTLSLLLIAVVQLLLAFFTAQALGFRSLGPLWVAILVAVLTGLCIIGTGLVVASFSKSVSQAFILANFPMALFMFFSGAIYPVHKIPLFTIGARTVGLYDFLPPTHAVMALNKVLTMGMGVGEVGYELGALIVLSILYFVAGVWLFNRMHLRAG
jgi:ABC-2 type transport system permease protein